MPPTETVKTVSAAVPDTSVCVMYPTRDAVSVQFHHALQEMERVDRAEGWHNFIGEIVEISGPNISKARNELVLRFLETEAEWAWFVDTDMVIKPETLPRLLCAAGAANAKVIGALCVMVGSDGPVPTIYQLGNLSNGEITRVMFDYPSDDTVLQVAATGTGCLLVHREVFEAMRKREPERKYPWFYEGEVNNNWTSEDLMFCLRANEAGYGVFVDCGAPVGHAKGQRVWWPSDIRAQRGFPPQYTAIVIPVKDRLDLTRQVVHELRIAGNYNDLIVVDNGSGKATRNWLSSQEDITALDMPDAGIHEMWNTAAWHALEKSGQRRNTNIVFLNNDLHLGENFVANLVTALRSDGRLAAVSGNYDGRSIEGPYQEVTEICANRYDGTGGFAGFAFAVKGEWLQSGYRFPEECKWWFGDNDLMMAIATARWKAGIAANAHCEHLDGGGGTAGDPLWERFQKETELDRIAFDKRWARIMGEEAVAA